LNTITIQHGLTLGIVPGTGLLFGLLLAAAIMGGYAAHTLRVPRIIGYLLAGVGVKILLPVLLGIEPGSDQASALAAAAGPLQAVKDLALGLILFSIGRVFETRHIRSVGRSILWISFGGFAVTLCTVSVGVFGVGWLSGVPVDTGVLAAFSLLLGLAATATAPAATLFTLQEYQAKGSMTDSILSVTGMACVLCIVGFHVVFLLMAGAGVLGKTALGGQGVWLGILLGTVGSVFLGAAFGFVIGVLHAKLQVAETLLILVASLIVLSAGERWLLDNCGVSYNALLTALCMGGVFVNAAIDPDRLDGAIGTVGPPLFVGFFVMAGYKLNLGELQGLGWVGVAYVLFRVVGKVIGSGLGVRWAGYPAGVGQKIGMGLMCQAAVVIGLADYVAAYWLESWPRKSFTTTILGSAVIFEICGPVLLKRLVVGCGEVKAVTLLRRSNVSPGGGQSIISLTVESLLRALGLGRRVRAVADEPLQTKHLMRTSVKTIPAGASFDEVMHLVERSRFNHFPVVDEDGRFMGLIRLGDLQEVIYDPTMINLVTAVDLADHSAKTVPIDMPLEKLLEVFLHCNLSSLPVIGDQESRQVVGIVERRDVLRAARSTSGNQKK